MSGFCLNVGLCCVNKFKVERAKLAGGGGGGGGGEEEGLGCLKSYF